MSGLRTYALPIAASAGFVLFSPLGLLVVFLSGDSCCGENTTGTMAAVTAVIVTLIAGAALLVCWAAKAIKRDDPAFSLRVAFLIVAGPASLIHVVFVVVVATTAF